MPPTFASRAFRLYASLERPRVPRGVEVMNPYTEPVARRCVRAFLDKYFDDSRKRVLVFGINPGRFGAGITGVTFTDPVALADFCGVPNDLGRKRELSSEFVYAVVARYGGPQALYRDFFLTAVVPLGFTKGGVNLNYYDIPELKRAVTPYVVSAVEAQIAMGGRTDHAVVLGIGQNAKFFAELNARHGWFGELHALEHPRWVMQYRRKRVGEFVEKYCALFRRLASSR